MNNKGQIRMIDLKITHLEKFNKGYTLFCKALRIERKQLIDQDVIYNNERIELLQRLGL